MSSDQDEKLVRDLARPVVAEAAPAELPVFRLLGDAYFADPERALSRRERGGGPLGFGPAEAIALLTPVVLLAMTEVVQHLVGELTDASLVRGREAGRRAIRRLFLRDRPDGEEGGEEIAPPIELSPEQWAEIHRIVVDTARRCDVPEHTAQVLGDAVLGAARRR